jgi:hypothetical protein
MLPSNENSQGRLLNYKKKSLPLLIYHFQPENVYPIKLIKIYFRIF